MLGCGGGFHSSITVESRPSLQLRLQEDIQCHSRRLLFDGCQEHTSEAREGSEAPTFCRDLLNVCMTKACSRTFYR